jgi:transcription-repair coupling factor (superfamily II helicase)
MLREAVAARKAQKNRLQVAGGGLQEEEHERPSVSLKVGVTYLIPETYVGDAAVRLQLYRRLAGLQGKEDIDGFRRELADRFGSVPAEVERLLEVMELRNRAASLNISRLEVGERGVVVAFHKGVFAAAPQLMTYIINNAGVLQIRAEKDGSQSLVWRKPIPAGDAQLKVVAWVVKELEKLVEAAAADVVQAANG